MRLDSKPQILDSRCSTRRYGMVSGWSYCNLIVEVLCCRFTTSLLVTWPSLLNPQKFLHCRIQQRGAISYVCIQCTHIMHMHRIFGRPWGTLYPYISPQQYPHRGTPHLLSPFWFWLQPHVNFIPLFPCSYQLHVQSYDNDRICQLGSTCRDVGRRDRWCSRVHHGGVILRTS